MSQIHLRTVIERFFFVYTTWLEKITIIWFDSKLNYEKAPSLLLYHRFKSFKIRMFNSSFEWDLRNEPLSFWHLLAQSSERYKRERNVWNLLNVNDVNDVNDVVLFFVVFLLLTFNRFSPLFWCFHGWF